MTDAKGCAVCLALLIALTSARALAEDRAPMDPDLAATISAASMFGGLVVGAITLPAGASGKGNIPLLALGAGSIAFALTAAPSLGRALGGDTTTARGKILLRLGLGATAAAVGVFGGTRLFYGDGYVSGTGIALLSIGGLILIGTTIHGIHDIATTPRDLRQQRGISLALIPVAWPGSRAIAAGAAFAL